MLTWQSAGGNICVSMCFALCVCCGSCWFFNCKYPLVKTALRQVTSYGLDIHIMCLSVWPDTNSHNRKQNGPASRLEWGGVVWSVCSSFSTLVLPYNPRMFKHLMSSRKHIRKLKTKPFGSWHLMCFALKKKTVTSLILVYVDLFLINGLRWRRE